MWARRMLPIAIVLMATTSAIAASPRPGTTHHVDEYAVIGRFLMAVDDYVVTHRWVETLGPEARCAPREGRIFFPSVAELFRQRIAETIRRHDVNPADLVSDMDEAEWMAPPIVVNDALPWGFDNPAAAWLVERLPRLPEDMDYRVIGRDLVLYDVRDAIVADVLRDAILLGR